ncbi:hypothetical protein M426DRAFT_126671 [Hypoxylon sp. CI-4A]|nr:hypothetical protein M426DRAFT_126671 [Hypoxylon sp. CI-4A]
MGPSDKCPPPKLRSKTKSRRIHKRKKGPLRSDGKLKQTVLRRPLQDLGCNKQLKFAVPRSSDSDDKDKSHPTVPRHYSKDHDHKQKSQDVSASDDGESLEGTKAGDIPIVSSSLPEGAKTQCLPKPAPIKPPPKKGRKPHPHNNAAERRLRKRRFREDVTTIEILNPELLMEAGIIDPNLYLERAGLSTPGYLAELRSDG